jgi:RHS repeat-associated protein
LGTVRDLVQYNTTTSTTTLVNHIQYDTFGQLTSQTNTSQTPWFGYTGREWDTATGLTYYRARWYDPRAGRFISEDPLSFAAGDVNLNRYVGNGATLWVDPSGMAGQPSRDDMASAMMAPLAWAQANNAVPKGDKHCGNLVFEQVFAHQGWSDYMWGVSPDVLGMVAYDGSDDNAKDLAREIARLMKLKRGLAEIRESVQKGVVAANVLVQVGNEPLDVIISTHEAITNPSWRTIAGALLSMLPFVPGIVGKADDVVDLGKAEDMAKREAASVAPTKITTPSPKLQQWAQQGGYVDPRTNKWIKFDGNLPADHVYPKDLIKKIDGFDRLTPQQQEFLLNYPGNFEPLPKSWNSSKLNRLANDWAKTPMGRQASQEYIDALRERQQAFEEFAKNLIDFWNQ